jgi:phage tail-like protein
MRSQHRFLVRIGDWPEIAFQDVSGLGPPPATPVTKITGINKAGDVTLKRGVVTGDAALLDWLKSVKAKPVRIKMLDERGRIRATWTLVNARPVKVTASDLNAKGNEIAIESIGLAHEGLELLP